MESAYMKKLIRRVGKSYKAIYNEKDSIGNFAGAKDLINKYTAMEMVVLNNGKKHGPIHDDFALTIVYHGIKRDFGGNLHLMFDERFPILHLISYETDVADYNIKTHILYMGEKYSPTTETHMQDFNILFGFKSSKVMKGTGTLKHSDIIGDYWTGLPVDNLLTTTTTELNLVCSLSQNKVFDELFMDIYNEGTNAYKVFKYQLKQMTQIILGAFNAYDDGWCHAGVADALLCNKLTNKTVLKAFAKLFKLMDTGTFTTDFINLTRDVDVNQYWDNKLNKLETRNLNKSYNTLKDIIKGILVKYGIFDKKAIA